MQRRGIGGVFNLNKLCFGLTRKSFFASGEGEFPTPNGDEDDPMYSDIPKNSRKKSERKPYPTPMKVLIRRAKEEKISRKAEPARVVEEAPGNGLLVPELVEVAHQVYRARESLIYGLSKIIEVVPVKRCRFCAEVHIGKDGHGIRTCSGPKSRLRNAAHVWGRGEVKDVVYFPSCFHLHDRVGKPRIGHDERSKTLRLPAIVELCIQAGLDLKCYPTKRRRNPVYSVEGRIVDFEKVEIDQDPLLEHFHPISQSIGQDGKNLGDLSMETLKSWLEMRSGAKKIMEKYNVQTCGYCPEVQVGPKGHKVRMCRASKHQSRNGLHAWQEATFDDIVGPNYVWHVKDLHKSVLVNDLKRFYGKAPAVLEVCIHGGAPIPDEYRSMLRLDVVPPECDEVDLVA
ncbi:hypothetical protein GIB67_017245 [Kingdonia uniflora]|uniref:APO domain-containing protein n=2 Tax=Kingdonia uniflora TaxID=39325 RepID=A0A7J7NC13_9MAGN|nr:hypothetical protein GIB67_017245 [Kingdonia uniflora]